MRPECANAQPNQALQADDQLGRSLSRPPLNGRIVGDLNSKQHIFSGVFALVLLTACDPGFRFAGRVTNPINQPLAGAEVWVDCHNGFREFLVAADRAGRFDARGLGWRPSTCTVVARAPGYADASLPLMSVCKKRPSHLDDACLEVNADPIPLKRSSP
jgi:hypothetical protein